MFIEYLNEIKTKAKAVRITTSNNIEKATSEKDINFKQTVYYKGEEFFPTINKIIKYIRSANADQLDLNFVYCGYAPSKDVFLVIYDLYKACKVYQVTFEGKVLKSKKYKNILYPNNYTLIKNEYKDLIDLINT